MAERAGELAIHFGPAALRHLDEIWHWNVANHGADHADAYVGFLLVRIAELVIDPQAVKEVPGRPDLRYVAVRKRRRGHGHIAVYAREGSTLEVLYLFHTAQDWLKKL